MTVPLPRPLPSRVIMALLLAGWLSPCCRAEEPAEQAPPEQLQAPKDAGAARPKETPQPGAGRPDQKKGEIANAAKRS